MCGRFNLIATPQQVKETFDLQDLPVFQSSYNITPGQTVLAIVPANDPNQGDGGLCAVQLLWGLIPSWSKDRQISHSLVNARAETVREKPSFRSAFQKRRALILANGYFEWQKLESRKQAFHLHRQDNALFAFAGLWEHWQHDQDTLYSCTIITTAAAGRVQPIHERMPVIMPQNYYHPWLDRTTDDHDVFQLLDNDAYSTLIATPVSDYVNNPRHNDERCLQAVAG